MYVIFAMDKNLYIVKYVENTLLLLILCREFGTILNRIH